MQQKPVLDGVPNKAVSWELQVAFNNLMEIFLLQVALVGTSQSSLPAGSQSSIYKQATWTLVKVRWALGPIALKIW